MRAYATHVLSQGSVLSGAASASSGGAETREPMDTDVLAARADTGALLASGATRNELWRVRGTMAVEIETATRARWKR